MRCTRSTPPAGCCCCTSTFLIDHFDLFGLRQVWLQLVGKPFTPLNFKTPWLYRQVRHPLYVGWLMIFWATPTMTVAHLVFAIMTTAYILVAIQFEERDLIAAHPEYAEYKKRVPSLIPFTKRRRGARPRVSRAGVPDDPTQLAGVDLFYNTYANFTESGLAVDARRGLWRRHRPEQLGDGGRIRRLHRVR